MRALADPCLGSVLPVLRGFTVALLGSPTDIGAMLGGGSLLLKAPAAVAALAADDPPPG